MSGSIKRLQREFKNFQQAPIREFLMYPLEDNMFEWHFTMMGPQDSPYQDGFYHGRILIPTNYPFAPPDVVLITPNGRFELEKRICLSISSYHPENWHPTWGIPTVLHALREFMLTPGNNAIGAIDYPNDVKLRMATQSVASTCPDCEAALAEHKATLLDSPPTTESDRVKTKEEALPTPELKAAASKTPTSNQAQEGRAVSEMAPLPPAGQTFPPPATTSNTDEQLLDTAPSSSNLTPSETASDEGSEQSMSEDSEGLGEKCRQSEGNDRSEAPLTPPTAGATDNVQPESEMCHEQAESMPPANPVLPAPPAAVAAEAAPAGQELEAVNAAAPAAIADLAAPAPAPVPVPRPAPARQMQQGGFEINISVSLLDRILLFLFLVICVLTCKKVVINNSTGIWLVIDRTQQLLGF